MRLMFLGDRIVGGYSAYTKITHETTTRLADLGHSVAHIPMGISNRMGKWSYKNVLVYPSGRDPWCEDVAVDHYVDWKADMLVTVKEPWVFNKIFQDAINFVPMAVIDHSPVNPAITSRLPTAFKVIAITRFGQRELRHKGIQSTYIPHGVNTDIYKPYKEKKAEWRKLWFMDPHEHIVGVVAMNRARKMIPHMLRGYRRFLDLNPDVKSHMMLLTNVRPSVIEEVTGGVSDVGVNLLPEIMDLELGEAVMWPEEKIILNGFPEWSGEETGWDMVKLYNTFDVLLMCTGGEGFGLPYIEAQACGVPVLSTDYAGGPEQVGAGLTVKWNDYVILSTPGTRFAVPDVDDIARALTKVMNADPEKMRRRARRFVMRYDWNKIINEYWVPFLDECESELRPLITKKGVKTW